MKPLPILLGVILGYVVATSVNQAHASDPDVYRSRVALESMAASLARCLK